MMPAEVCHQQLDDYMRTRPFDTPNGRVLPGTANAFLGSPRGGHAVPPMFKYRYRGAPLDMVFQFYRNFSEHDLICKVTKSGNYPNAGQGASIQFNGHTSFLLDGNSVAFRHHGLFTIGKRIARPRFVELMHTAASAVATTLGIGPTARDWPMEIGTLRDVPVLIDRLFYYAYRVEQAKRRYRSEALLVTIVP